MRNVKKVRGIHPPLKVSCKDRDGIPLPRVMKENKACPSGRTERKPSPKEGSDSKKKSKKGRRGRS